jgi:hypothetical protein
MGGGGAPAAEAASQSEQSPPSMRAIEAETLQRPSSADKLTSSEPSVLPVASIEQSSEEPHQGLLGSGSEMMPSTALQEGAAAEPVRRRRRSSEGSLKKEDFKSDGVLPSLDVSEMRSAAPCVAAAPDGRRHSLNLEERQEGSMHQSVPTGRRSSFKRDAEHSAAQMAGVPIGTSCGQQEWLHLSTMEQWTRWCSNTEHLDNHDELGFSHPLQKAAEDISSIRCVREKRHDKERCRMRRMIAQGIHRTKSGLGITATHLPKDITSNSYSAHKYRHDALEEVDQYSRRIKRAINHTATARQELKHCKEALAAIEPKQNEDFCDSLASRFHKNQPEEDTRRWRRSLTTEIVNNFTEDSLTEEEQHTRALARSLGMALPDADAILAQFKHYTRSSRGITSKTFPKMLNGLTGEEHSDAQVHELWRSADKDGRGIISFDQYLVWHFDNCGDVRLGFHASESPERVASPERRVASPRASPV